LRFQVKFIFLSRPLIFVIFLTLELPCFLYLSKLGPYQEDIFLLKITMKCGRLFPNGTAYLKNHENLICSCVVIALQQSICACNTRKCTWKSWRYQDGDEGIWKIFSCAVKAYLPIPILSFVIILFLFLPTACRFWNECKLTKFVKTIFLFELVEKLEECGREQWYVFWLVIDLQNVLWLRII
jgi:hypothetical protein